MDGRMLVICLGEVYWLHFGEVEGSALFEKRSPERLMARSGSTGDDIIAIIMMSLLSIEVLMGQLIVRNLDDKLVRALKLRAARKGRSAEAEHREILREALAGRRGGKTLKDFLVEMPAVGEDADFARPRDFGRRTKL